MPTAYFIDLYSYGSHDNIVSEKAANGTALVQPVQPVSPSTLMDSSNSTSEGCSSASPLQTSGSDDSTDQPIINETLPLLSHLKEIVVRRFIELKAVLLIESRGISLLEITHTTVHLLDMYTV